MALDFRATSGALSATPALLAAAVIACLLAAAVMCCLRRLKKSAAFRHRRRAFLAAERGYDAGVERRRPRELPALARRNEVYLDYAGAALETASQARARSDELLGNPHAAGGPFSERAAAAEAKAKALVLKHLGAAGYEVVWTSGATAALKLVADLYPFEAGDVFAHGRDAHTSVVGCRFAAARAGASCAVVDDWAAWGARRGLAVLSPESNVDGACIHDVRGAVARAREGGAAVVLDLANYAATHDVVLADLGAPDAVALSLYKLFGAPTGLGCLVAARGFVERLRAAKARGLTHVGGGSVARLCGASGFFALKPGAAALGGGTPHFRAFGEAA
eukprot:CAMPEP_0119281540 /NCGR_PEP_ID=MMETSP1329-20130426/24954_1 /TAXON_ID=114041 /ORGANISM="Genus nov. species nov., Strain RCC1024" /LENGTH=334 /DNA_ID=CAMNT_0007282163 /DNA_START=38 /DNA_END=1038 /DNA_ORIENTATION=+